MDRIEILQDTIRHLHGCESRHDGSVAVTESFQGQIVWDGTVEVFALDGHSSAARCYAWTAEQDDGSYRRFAVLEVPPVDSPLAAVRAMIVAESKKSP